MSYRVYQAQNNARGYDMFNLWLLDVYQGERRQHNEFKFIFGRDLVGQIIDVYLDTGNIFWRDFLRDKFRRSFIRNDGGFDFSIKIGGDWCTLRDGVSYCCNRHEVAFIIQKGIEGGCRIVEVTPEEFLLTGSNDMFVN
jgi:hypothetical protein